MATQCYFAIPHPIKTLLTWVKSGEVTILDVSFLSESLLSGEAFDYDDFLEARRKLMAQKIKICFEGL